MQKGYNKSQLRRQCQKSPNTADKIDSSLHAISHNKDLYIGFSTNFFDGLIGGLFIVLP